MSKINIVILIALALWAIFVTYGATYLWKVLLSSVAPESQWAGPALAMMVVTIIMTIVSEITILTFVFL